jgi:hypothetical protein
MVGEQQLRQIPAAMKGRQVQRRLAVAVGGIDIRALSQQKRYKIRVVLRCRRYDGFAVPLDYAKINVSFNAMRYERVQGRRAFKLVRQLVCALNAH